jgi:hypothetical protein
MYPRCWLTLSYTRYEEYKGICLSNCETNDDEINDSGEAYE